MPKYLNGGEIRQQFVDYFIDRGHTFVHSASLVPGNDQTLLFTNAGMVQFKDIFLGTDNREYKRAVNSQKCMRVSGKHNDLDDVGRDNTHHTFFEMLGNWSFGDYYKKDAIAWAWDLLVNTWDIDPKKLWVTCFKDEKGQIPTDDEAVEVWSMQPKIEKNQILFFGRKENFWEMAETGPCGPCSEIHIDRGIEFCDKQNVEGHECRVNHECARFVELWNLVFIQYNRISESELIPLPAKHVDTGMGLDRIVSVIQNKDSNYATDLLFPLIEIALKKAGKKSLKEISDITPYRVIADHTRAAAFLIADGVVPGNIGRNYICRMIIRRAARFGSKIGLNEPFMADIAQEVVNINKKAYPELEKNKNAIVENLTREELKFKETVANGLNRLEELLLKLKESDQTVISGEIAFDLYATHGLPLEITRDEVRERGMFVDDKGFYQAMENHRVLSGAGKAIGQMRADGAEFYSQLLSELIKENKIGLEGVLYNPYQTENVRSQILALIRDGQPVNSAETGDQVEVILRDTNFYIESGGQISDTGLINAVSGEWSIAVSGMAKPVAGVITHIGKVIKGNAKVNDSAVTLVDRDKRSATMRNHTATHLLHAVLQRVLGGHARQAGSLVSPEKLRFDFNHPESINADTLRKIEHEVNSAIFENKELVFVEKTLENALKEGATALFGEKYSSQVRTVSVHSESLDSYELCGGTHVGKTGDIGLFIIISEGSVAAGIRRIEAVTGIKAFEFVQKRLKDLEQAADLLKSSQDDIVHAVEKSNLEKEELQKRLAALENSLIQSQYEKQKDTMQRIGDTDILFFQTKNGKMETLRSLADRFRREHNSGIAVFSTISADEKNQIIVVLSNELVEKGFHAGTLAKSLAVTINGSGGGKPDLAQAGGSGALDRDKVLGLIKMFLG